MVDKWNTEPGGYCLNQTPFIEGRLDPVSVPRACRGQLGNDALAPPAAAADNKSAVGSLGWVVDQTCPDVATRVSFLRRTQGKPTFQDISEANAAIRYLKRTKGAALHLPRLRSQGLCLVVFHDAAWGNTWSEEEPPTEDEPTEGEKSHS